MKLSLIRIIKYGEYYDYYVNVYNIYLINECKKNNKISVEATQFKFIYGMYLFYLLINKNIKLISKNIDFFIKKIHNI